jgi:hypothetical protein
MLIAAVVPLLLLADVSPQSSLGVWLVPQAEAIVGRPLTPMSYAGVARRTTARVVAVEATAVTATAATVAAATSSAAAATAAQQQAVAQQQAATAAQQAAVAQQQATVAQQQAAGAIGRVVPALPAGCAPFAKGGVEYYRCSDGYYRAVFQGNNLVYVTVAQP